MQALEGVRVLDLSRLLPGPYCTQILADLGAEVIKVEEPTLGDYMRWFPPLVGGVSAFYLMVNRNKKSITLNLKNPKGREAFMRLAKAADVIVEGFRPGVAKRLGVDYESVKSVNPRIIYCSITGYGQTGPYKDQAGHEINYLAYAGVLSLTGQRGGPPAIPGVQVADLAGALYAAISILAALRHRDRTGTGQYIDVSILDCVVSLLCLQAGFYFATGRPPLRGEFMLQGGVPCYNIYRTSDGKYIAVGAVEEQFWKNLCKALGLEEFTDYEYAVGKDKEKVYQALAKKFESKTRDEWVEELKNVDCCCTPIYTLDEVFSDKHVLSRGILEEIEDEQLGKIKVIGYPARLGSTPAVVRSSPPSLGEHTEEILASLGYTEREIEEMRREGAI